MRRQSGRVRPRQRGSALIVFVFALVLIGGLSWLGWSVWRHDVPFSRSSEAALANEGLSVLFSPGNLPGRPMRLDRLEVQARSQLAFFQRAGLRELAGEADPQLGRNYLKATGFPVLELAWPSHYLPPGPVCSPGKLAFSEACPVFTYRLLSWPLDDRAALLRGEGQLPAQQHVPYEERVVTQWVAFHTRQDLATGQAQWAGWSCDAARLAKVGQRIGSWGAERGIFAALPGEMAADCHQAGSRLARWFERGAQVHGVLWTCGGPQRADAGRQVACQAEFEHGGRRIVLEVPGGPLGPLDDYQPAALRVRSKLVQAAWLALEQAALAAKGPATPVDWQRRLAREFGWCEALVEQSNARQRQGMLSRQQARERWGNEWRLDSVQHRSPCASALHRILHLRGEADPPPTLLAYAQRLAEIEREQVGGVSEPLWTLVGELLATPGQPPSMALVRWQAQPPYLAQRAPEVLAALDAMPGGVRALPPGARVALLRDLAHALEGGSHAGRTGQLFFDAALEAGAAPGLLPDLDTAYLLAWAAVTARRLPEPQRSQRLAALLPLMERQAMVLHADAASGSEPLWAGLSTLAVHAAWSAQTVVQQGGFESARWRGWLHGWASWSATAFGAQRPKVVRAIAWHRDAARPGARLLPDCAGGPVFDCSMPLP